MVATPGVTEQRVSAGSDPVSVLQKISQLVDAGGSVEAVALGQAIAVLSEAAASPTVQFELRLQVVRVRTSSAKGKPLLAVTFTTRNVSKGGKGIGKGKVMDGPSDDELGYWRSLRVKLEDDEAGRRTGEVFRSLTVVWNGKQYHGSNARRDRFEIPDPMKSLSPLFREENGCVVEANWENAEALTADIHKWLQAYEHVKEFQDEEEKANDDFNASWHARMKGQELMKTMGKAEAVRHPGFSLNINSLLDAYQFTNFTSLKQLFDGCTFLVGGDSKRNRHAQYEAAVWPCSSQEEYIWSMYHIEGAAVPINAQTAVADDSRVVAIGGEWLRDRGANQSLDQSWRLFILETNPRLQWTECQAFGAVPRYVEGYTLQACRVGRHMFILREGSCRHGGGKGGGLYVLDLDNLIWRCVHGSEHEDDMSGGDHQQSKSPYFTHSGIFIAVSTTHLLKIGGWTCEFGTDSENAWLLDLQSETWRHVPVKGLTDCTSGLGTALLSDSQLCVFMGYGGYGGYFRSAVLTAVIDVEAMNGGEALEFIELPHKPLGVMQSENTPTAEGRPCVQLPYVGPQGEVTVLICNQGSDSDEFVYAITFSRSQGTVASVESQQLAKQIHGEDQKRDKNVSSFATNFTWSGGYPLIGGRVPTGLGGHAFLEVNGKFLLFGGFCYDGATGYSTASTIRVLERFICWPIVRTLWLGFLKPGLDEAEQITCPWNCNLLPRPLFLRILRFL